MADGVCAEGAGEPPEKASGEDYERTRSVGGSVVGLYSLCSKDHRDHGAKQKEGFLDADSPTSLNEEDCRSKKRCADRYDSSESSDSGVAQLSCTTCSGYGGSSTASSDLTDPGSPFSSSSSHHSEDSAPAPPSGASMAPHTPWPWAESPTSKRATDKVACSSASPKRPRTEGGAVPGTPPSPSQAPSFPQAASKAAKKPDQPLIVQPLIVQPLIVQPQAQKTQQGKITEYFKAQFKMNGTKKELSNILVKTGDFRNPTNFIRKNTHLMLDTHKNSASADVGAVTTAPGAAAVSVQELITLIGGSKVLLTGGSYENSSEFYRKVDVQKVVQKGKKPPAAPRKILPKPEKGVPAAAAAAAPARKFATIRVPPQEWSHLNRKPAKPPDHVGPKGGAAAKLAHKRGTPASAAIHPKLTPSAITLSATVVPIVKLNNLPSTKTSVNHSDTSSSSCSPEMMMMGPKPLKSSSVVVIPISVETAVPTVPVAKHKASPATAGEFPLSSAKHHSSLAKCLEQQQQLQQKQPKTTQDSSALPSSASSTTSSTSSSNSDSGLSEELTISVACLATDHIEPQKSPILSQPKTIRFPARPISSSHDRRQDSTDSGLCRWSNCNSQFDTSGALLDHLQVKHVISQATQEHYVCLWEGCKVHGRTSCSRSWLERHVLGHAGNKPFRCIVDGCGCRFSSQLALQRHVNGHFTANVNGTTNGSSSNGRRSLDSGSARVLRKTGKRIRMRRQPWSARMFDFFDAGIMEGLQHRLVRLTERLEQKETADPTSGDSVTLRSRVMGKRTRPDGTKELLLSWSPPDVIPDEWITEGDFSPTRIVRIPTLEPSSMDNLRKYLFATDQMSRGTKQRRKPERHTT